MPDSQRPRPLSLDTINRDHEGQWVIVRVTSWAPSPANVPIEGQLLAHGSRQSIDVLLAELPLGESSGNPYYVFRAAKPITSEDELRALLERATMEEPPLGD